MEDKQPVENFTAHLLNDLRNAAGILGLIAGTCYVIGFLIVSTYLNQFGATYLSLIQARYIAAGLLYLFLCALTLAGPGISYYVWRQERAKGNHTRRWRLLGLIFLNMLLIGVVVWVMGLLLTQVDHRGPFADSLFNRQRSIWLGLPASQLALIFPFAVAWVVTRLIQRRPRQQSGQDVSSATVAKMSQAILGGFSAICVLISLYVFAVWVYPNASPSFGGGAPISVRLLLSDESSLNSFNISAPGGLTEPLTLIDQSNDRLLLVNSEGQVIELSSQDIKGLLHFRPQ
jgi:hypothetical protein